MADTSDLIHRLAATRTIYLTTSGRRSRLPRTIEIWWFHFEGRFVISGTPGRRDWLANARANPSVTVTVAGHTVEATATEIDDPGFRLRFFTSPETRWYSNRAELEQLVASAPMIEVSW